MRRLALSLPVQLLCLALPPEPEAGAAPLERRDPAPLLLEPTPFVDPPPPPPQISREREGGNRAERRGRDRGDRTRLAGRRGRP